ncbi:MAG TPA: prolyl oligopeptidase family serine peptidase [Planctomycetota bacterium]|nr:prolyl oligopeptidase family serine peptidase [Planctomycetota bacterium]
MRLSFLLAVLLLQRFLFADGPQDNIPGKVRPIPAKGVEVPADKKEKMASGLAELKSAIDALRQKKDAFAHDLLPDVEIFYRAVHDGLKYQEFLKENEIEQAFKLLETGKQRAADLAQGKAPWATQTGLVARGFVSKLDNSVQPYGVWIPESYSFSGAQKYRTDFWFHGRAEHLTEGNFLALRMKGKDQIEVYNPKDTIVVYPYARYCNANKFAGEVDTLEALAEAQRRYRIDEERISSRGFSMGGAAAWHIAVHYADRWFAANPGAGFSETPRFLDVFQNEKLSPTPWEKKLWNMYDCDKWALNLTQCPTIAYSGANDKQKQAADVMVEACAERGIELVHIVAPNTAHKVEPEAGKLIERRMEALARNGRNRVPRSVDFETYTLKYNRMNWVVVDGLGEHWERAEVRAKITGDSSVTATTVNVTDLSFVMEPGDCPLSMTEPVTISIDGQKIKQAPRPLSDRSWRVSLHLEGKKWKLGARTGDGLRKRHDLQGPIDDALMQPFIFVKPTGTPANELAGKWAAAELERAIEHWRRHFRGYAIVKEDTAVTDDDIASRNLILWGDPGSNAIIKRISDKLPVRWDAKNIIVGKQAFDAAQHAAILVAPNPLNPKRYVVLNSSFTFREFAYLNNARQVSMLPDWAVVDLREAPGTIRPGRIAAAGFFDEQWNVKEPRD